MNVQAQVTAAVLARNCPGWGTPERAAWDETARDLGETLAGYGWAASPAEFVTAAHGHS